MVKHGENQVGIFLRINNQWQKGTTRNSTLPSCSRRYRRINRRRNVDRNSFLGGEIPSKGSFAHRRNSASNGVIGSVAAVGSWEVKAHPRPPMKYPVLPYIMDVPDRLGRRFIAPRTRKRGWIFHGGSAKREDWPWCRSPPILAGDVGVCHGGCAAPVFL